MTGYQASKSSLSLSPQSWDYECVPQCPVFSHGFWEANSDPHACKASIFFYTGWPISLSPDGHFYKTKNKSCVHDQKL